MDLKDISVNGTRLRRSMEEMAGIGATPGGGVERLTLTDEDRRARDRFLQWLGELDLDITVDEMGNIFGQRKGGRSDLAPVVSGSHLDSQPRGGRFDGVLGVMGTLEVLRTLNDHHVTTERPVCIVNWTNEEGSRFAPAMVGSGVWSGLLERNWVYDRRDREEKRFKDELERIGYRGPAPAASKPVHAYYEYHIEQGPILEREKMTIGAPEGIFCIHWYDVYLEGEGNQAGPTPMEGRRDALVTAAEMIVNVNELPAKMGGNMVATVGEIENRPNSRNIIPDGVHFTVDIRSRDDGLVVSAWEKLLKRFVEISNRRGCPMRIEETWKVAHQRFHPDLVRRVVNIAEQLGYPVLRMCSGAGHDAGYMNQVAPTAMIFVPSIGGRSHVEVENTRWEDCEAGANVLLHCILKTANDVAGEGSDESDESELK